MQCKGSIGLLMQEICSTDPFGLRPSCWLRYWSRQLITNCGRSRGKTFCSLACLLAIVYLFFFLGSFGGQLLVLRRDDGRLISFGRAIQTIKHQSSTRWGLRKKGSGAPFSYQGAYPYPPAGSGGCQQEHATDLRKKEKPPSSISGHWGRWREGVAELYSSSGAHFVGELRNSVMLDADTVRPPFFDWS